MKFDWNNLLARLSFLSHSDAPTEDKSDRIDKFKAGIQARRRRNKFIRHQRDYARRMNRSRGQLITS